VSFVYTDGGLEHRHCEGCGRRERVPPDASAAGAKGWLFMQEGGLTYRHFCPGCYKLLSKCRFVRQVLFYQAGKLS
jgi:hypothetical protein